MTAPTPTTEETYPCRECGKLRTKAEGGTTFTVCDECWDKAYAKYKRPVTTAPTAASEAVETTARAAVEIIQEIRAELGLDKGESVTAAVRKLHEDYLVAIGMDVAKRVIAANRKQSVPNATAAEREGAERIELAARAICTAWGYEWDVPAGHRCDEFTDCPFLCSEDADDKPTKRMCREAAKQAIAPLTAALLAAQSRHRAEANDDRREIERVAAERDSLYTQLAAARRENDAAIATLRPYLDHRDECKKVPRIVDGITYGSALPPHDCTCGLDAALAATQEGR